MKNFENAVKDVGLNLKKNQSLARYTTIKVGGMVDFFVISENSDQLKETVFLAKQHDIPFFILGKGSNVIISDEGYRGIVIINTSKKWEIIGKVASRKSKVKAQPRFKSDYSGFEYKTTGSELNNISDISVRTDSGVGVNYLMHELYKKGVTGLQWYAGIPATIGGAIYMNMHGGEYFFGDLVLSATLIDGTEVKKVSNDYFKFDYDWSILHQTKEIILEADLCLKDGDLESAIKISNEWARYKAQQPRRSAGCIFRNLSTEEVQILGLPTTSVGYLIDKILGLKGKRIGDAVIAEQHAAFIENLGQATASDIYDLVQFIKQKAKTDLGTELHEEVQFIGKF